MNPQKESGTASQEEDSTFCVEKVGTKSGVSHVVMIGVTSAAVSTGLDADSASPIILCRIYTDLLMM